jgi:lysine N6-hydroxylase
MTQQVYTLIGIGIGPFNLGLAALLEPVAAVSALFFDQHDSFDWHPGLMLDGTTLQDPFMGTDLVTMADPTSQYTFLNYLKQTGRLYQFFIRHDFYMLRSEYNAYCQWVAKQLPACRFSSRVTDIAYDGSLYAVRVQHLKTKQELVYYAQKLVLGTGTQPYTPAFIPMGELPGVFHSSQYLANKEAVLRKGQLTIVGSGQSAAEVFNDLLPEVKRGFKLHWFTRSDRFFPMEHSKLTLEISSPDYVDYFYSLSEQRRKKILVTQNSLSKGINYDLVDQIYDQLYEMTVGGKPVSALLNTNVELTAIAPGDNDDYTLHFTQVVQDRSFTHQAATVLLATGYRYNTLACIAGIAGRINRNGAGQFAITRDYAIDINGNEIFVQNAETHTHGFTAPDLSLGAHRNSRIIKTITGKEIYSIDERIAYQRFGAPVATYIPEPV